MKKIEWNYWAQSTAHQPIMDVSRPSCQIILIFVLIVHQLFPKQTGKITQEWLSLGQMHSESSLLPGLLCSSHNVSLAVSGKTDSHTLENGVTTKGNGALKTKSLPAPDGNYRFLVGSFGLQASRLVAINIISLAFLYFDPETNQWIPLDDADNGLTRGSALSVDSWGCVVADPVRSGKIFLASTAGLVGVMLDLVNRKVRTQLLAEGRPIAAPAVINGCLCMPIEVDGCKQVFWAEVQNISATAKFEDLPEATAPEYRPPVCSGGKIIWMCKTNQLVTFFDNKKIKSDVLPWMIEVEPLFELSVPTDKDGYWQLCFNQQKDSFTHVRLGGIAGEKEITPSQPQLSTGKTLFVDDQVLKSGKSKVENKLSNNGKIMIPLAQFNVNAASSQSGTPSVVCIHLESTESLEDVFQQNAPVFADLVLLGEPDRVLDSMRVSAPWKSQVFVYDNHLWFFHPEREVVTGWELTNND